MSQFKDHFSPLAAQYAQFRPGYPPELFAYLASLCPRTSRAWDCACGSGQASASLAAHFDAVIATDASATQIAAAAAYAKVEYRIAPAEASGLEPGDFDLVTVAQALHWFDIDRFYAEAKRVLRPEGVLAVWAYGIQHVEDSGIDRKLQHFYHDVVGPYWPPERRIVESGYRSLPFPFHELTPPPFSLNEHWTLPQLLGYFRSWSATGRYVADRGVDPVVELGEEVARAWGDPQQRRRVSWPLAMRVGRREA